MNRLSECKKNEQLVIKYLEGDVEKKRHLQDLGFVPLATISVVSFFNEGMIVQVFDSRIAINNEISNCIYGTILKKEKNKKNILSRFRRR